MGSLFKNFDWSILIAILLLFGIGGATIASVVPDLLPAQVLFFAIGLGLFFFFSRIDHRIFPSLAWLIYWLAIVFFLFTLFLGLESHGAVRWISLGAFRLQFSEIFKPFLILSFASFFSKIPKNSFRVFFLLMLLILLPSTLIFKQPDFGSALVYLLTLTTMLLFSGVNLIYIAISVVSGIILTPLVWRLLAAYQKNRLLSFISPNYDPLGASYNAIQSVIAVGSGMLLGRGLGRGTQSHLAFLPEHHTDFIFASVAEELGFVGAGFVLAVYFFLLWRIFSLLLKIENSFSRLVILGLGLYLLVQGTINIGMNLGLLPVTGVPLPLVSYGGSSLLSTMITLGLVENIAKSQSQRETESDLV
ncbi:MAG: Rod shape-determining protein RodA [Microgenomates group bacterium GW2011_GWA1_48_10]|uniref:Rod shape-determining protein RodA n=1 Tax=Candidatus Gottesmanbacteria bacterium RIFCSPHIGHO2_01_FULL_47_48 TaxID=1798381 RepID=A0A1F6A4T6_9BACT|nr:MAG: Rod shape-determining protein RodA [Microgenomates group bacterium GW2011_GWA1_48_10]OGG19709.1 MAG: rod shape-determining protein RodA [Candidatus Gottesmanbacteria bacterium RIFCSPHIGHO2_01_FULL_47_48]